MKKCFKEYVSAELRSLRSEFDYTQKEVADKAKVDVMTVVRYENNSVSMQLDIIEKILSVYNIECYIFFNNLYAKMQKNKER